MAFPDHSRIELCNTTDGSQVTVYLQGAHVTSWRTKDGEEHLYNSPKSVYKAGKAIRGGVPLIYPQFSDLGPLPASHGFLRVSHGWRLVSSATEGPKHVATLAYDMACGAAETGFEGARAELRYTVAFTATELSLTMAVKNTHATDSLTFGLAFHSYFGVADIESVAIAGLDDAAWLDNLHGRKQMAPQPIHAIREEVDRIYLGQEGRPVTVSTFAKDGASKTLSIVGAGLTEAVLWNPWVEKCGQTADLPADGYRHFLCVEHGRICEKATVAPGAEFVGTQTISVS